MVEEALDESSDSDEDDMDTSTSKPGVQESQHPRDATDLSLTMIWDNKYLFRFRDSDLVWRFHLYLMLVKKWYFVNGNF